MSHSKWLLGAAALLVSGSVLVFAEDTPKTAKTHAHAAKLTKPWSELTSLSDDQKKQILEIHAKANEEIKVIHEKEHGDIIALLSADQKKELTELEEKDSESRKAHSKSEPTTKPAEEKSAK